LDVSRYYQLLPGQRHALNAMVIASANRPAGASSGSGPQNLQARKTPIIGGVQKTDSRQRSRVKKILAYQQR